MKMTLLLPLALLISVSSAAQTRADKWYFGTNAGIDFTSGTPTVINSALTTSEGTAAISSPAGSPLFYTNGETVWNASNNIMPDGTGLMGDVSTTQTIIVPSPASTSQYYIFTNAPDGGANGFRYSIVDMTLDGGSGAVLTTSKNILVTDSTTEKVAAIKSDQGDSYWIVMHKWGTDEFYSYELTASGLQPPVISHAGAVHSTSTFQNTYGQMKFNMCGTKLAVAVGYQDIAEVFDFDMATGSVSNPITINMGDHVYGVEFSRNGNLLYVTSYNPSVKLAQFNISLGALPLILASQTPLSVTDDLYGLQLGPDGKIYVARSFGASHLGVVANPDIPGSGCSYSDNGFDLDPSFMGVNAALSLPSFVQTFLKVGVSCGPVGIEDEIQNEGPLVYPNPAVNNFNIDLTAAGHCVVTIFDATGRIIERQEANGSVLHFGNDYEKGMYLVEVLSERRIHRTRILKE